MRVTVATVAPMTAAVVRRVCVRVVGIMHVIAVRVRRACSRDTHAMKMG